MKIKSVIQSNVVPGPKRAVPGRPVVNIYGIDENPIQHGLSAPLGTIAIQESENSSSMYFKYGPSDDNWRVMSSSTSGSGGTPFFKIRAEGGDTSESDIYNTWEDAYDAFSQVSGYKVVEIQDETIIPAGQWNLDGVKLIAPNSTKDGNPSNCFTSYVYLGDGCSFINWNVRPCGIFFISQSTEPICILRGSGDQTSNFLILGDSCGYFGNHEEEVAFFEASSELTSLYIKAPAGSFIGSYVFELKNESYNYIDFIATEGRIEIDEPDAFIQRDENVSSGLFIEVTSESYTYSSDSYDEYFKNSNPSVYRTQIHVDYLFDENWDSYVPSNLSEILNRMANLLKTLNGGNPIP